MTLTPPYESVKLILDDFVAQVEVAGVGRWRTLLQALVKEITFDRGEGITCVRMRLHEGAAQALGMADGPRLASVVEAIA